MFVFNNQYERKPPAKASTLKSFTDKKYTSLCETTEMLGFLYESI